MDELAWKRKESAQKKIDDEQKRKQEEEEKRKKSLEEKKLAEQKANEEAEAARKKALDERKDPFLTNDREERRKALEEMRLKREEAKQLKLGLIEKKKEEKPLSKEEEKKKKEMEEIRRKDLEEAEKKRKEAEKKKTPQREVGPDEVEKEKKEKRPSKDEEKEMEKFHQERESRLKKRKEEEENARKEQEELVRKMEAAKTKALAEEAAKKEEQEKRKKQMEEEEKVKRQKEEEVGLQEKKVAAEKSAKEKAEAALKMQYEADDVDKMTMKRKTMKKQTFDKDELPDDQKVRESLTADDQFVMAGALKVETRKAIGDEEEEWEFVEEEDEKPRELTPRKYEESKVEFDDVEEFLNKRRMQRLQLDEVQAFEELPRATRHRTMRKGFVSLPDSQLYASRGDTVVFECELFNESDTVDWQINGKSLNEFNDGRCSIQNYAYIRQLTIGNVVPKDSGLKVSITLEGQTHQSKLTIEEVPVEFAEKLPRKVIANVGDTTATIVAILTHDCAKNISWYHNGQPLFTDNTYQIINEGCICSLLVREIDYKLGGRYTISADKVESSTILEIHGKPSMEFTDIGLQRIVIDANENLTLKVRLKSLPEPEVDLYLNNELLTPELRTSVTILEESVLVTRRELSRHDRGIYKLVLFNEYGEDSLEYDVYVRDVPDAPSGLMVTEVGHDYCFLKWNPPLATGVSDERERITGYVIEKKGTNRRVWQRVGQLSAYSLEIFIEDLDYDTDYVFRVAATNRFGVGEFSKLAQITTGTPFSAPVMHSAPRISHTYERSVRLEWDECWDTGGSPLFGYDVFCKIGSDWQKLNESTVFTENFWVDEFLDASKNGCVFKVEAQNYAGLHSDSNIISEPLQVDEQSIASHAAQHQQMSAPKVTILGGTRVRVSWEMPEWLGSIAGPKYFVVQYRSEGTYLWNEVLEQYKQSPAIVEDELKEGVPYKVRVVLRSTGETEKEEISASDESDIIKISGFNVPILTKTLRDALIPKKEEVCLEICAVSEPAPLFVWLKNGEEIVPSPEYDNVSISNEGYASKLVIHRMGENDEGYYTCQISNEYGMIETKAFIRMGKVQAHFINSFAEKITATEGKDVVLECEVSDPEASVSWTRNKRHIGETTNRISLEQQGYKRRLILYGAMKEDSGIYTCEIETATGSDKKVQTEIVVRPEKARIVFSPQGRIICHYGEKIQLYADLSKSAEDVVWYKDGLPLQCKKCFAYFEGTKALLEIYNFDESDIGEYSISLEGGEKSAPAKLRFEVSPKIELRRYHHEERIVKIGGDEFTVTANLLGWPTPKLSILLNDNPINDAKQVVVNAGVGCGEVHTINIRSLKRSHSGRIWLRASNEFGEDSSYIDLKVLDVPSAPINLHVRNITSSSVDLYWNIAESDSSYKGEEFIESFIVERKTGERQRWRQLQRKTAERIKTDTGEYVYTIQGLYPGESYAFRVLAFNEIGESEPSKAIDVDLPQEQSDDEEEERMIEGIRRRLSSTEILQRKISETLPPLERPSKPTVSTDGLQTKAILSWEQVDRAMLYGIERRRLSASSETDFWLEVANIERTTFIDRSIYETGRYVYRIVAKLPGVMNSEAGTQSEEVFITVQNVLDEGGSKSRLERRMEQHRYPEDSDASTSSSVQSLLDSGIQDDDGFHSPMKSLRKKVSISKEGGSSGRRVSFAEDKKSREEKRKEDKLKFKEEMEEQRPSSSSSYEFRGEFDKLEGEEMEMKEEEREEDKKEEKEEKLEEKVEETSEAEVKPIRTKILKKKTKTEKEVDTNKIEENIEDKSPISLEKEKIEEKEDVKSVKKIQEETKSEEDEIKVEKSKKQDEQGVEIKKYSSVGFEVPLNDIEAVEGQLRVEMVAKLEKSTRDTLMRAKWFKDGKLLNARTLKHKALLDNKGEAKLVINKIEKADEGLYKLELELSNREQSKPSTQAYLSVREKGELPKAGIETKTTDTGRKPVGKVPPQEAQKTPPKFVKKPKPNAESIKGSRICLSGSFSGFPLPKLKWLRNGKEFLADEFILLNINYNEDLELNEFMLEILKFTPPEHEGTYTALIQNEHGSDSVSILVSELSLEDKMKNFGVSEKKLPEDENSCINNSSRDKIPESTIIKNGDKDCLVNTKLVKNNSKVELDIINNKNINDDKNISNDNININICNNKNNDNKNINDNKDNNNNTNNINNKNINENKNNNYKNISNNKNINESNNKNIDDDKNINENNNKNIDDNKNNNNYKNISNNKNIDDDKNINENNNKNIDDNKNINENNNNNYKNISNNKNIDDNKNINENKNNNNYKNIRNNKSIDDDKNINERNKNNINDDKNINENNNTNKSDNKIITENKNNDNKNYNDDINNTDINNTTINTNAVDSNSKFQTKIWQFIIIANLQRILSMRRKNAKMSTASTISSTTLASINIDEDVQQQQNQLSTETTTTNGINTTDILLQIGADGEQQKFELNDEELDDNTNKEQRQKKTLQIINAAIEQRNSKICRPRFFARPKPHKQVAEGKSLRLKAAISANPTPQVYWDRNGIRLETGSKYSIFQDGQVHFIFP
uniref:Uncharacterized protein n=1 Tax=Meloidogyne incognita TaxID=6306 RepID=A0A914N1I4_MELIC